MQWLLVFAFGGLGALARVAIATGVGPRGFPIATLAVNGLGCLLIGVAFALLEEVSIDAAQPIRAALVGGFLGGFTTFSAFGLETFGLLGDGRPVAAAAYAGGSVLLGVLAVAAGIGATRALT